MAIPERPDELTARTPLVLETLYLVFNEGHSASDGELPVRQELCGEALRLALFVTRHAATGSPAAHALVALMLFHLARLPTRATPAGDVVLLADQDRARWDARLTGEAFRQLDRAAAGTALTRYHVEAQIASYHAAAPSYEGTDWAGVLAAYDVLLALAPSPVAGVHRAVAAGMAHGPHAALAELARLADDPGAAPVVARYVSFHAARGHWHARAGDAARAAEAYRRALSLPSAGPVRRFLAGRLRAVE